MKLTGGGINMELKQEILNNLSNRKLTLPKIIKIMHIKGEEMGSMSSSVGQTKN